MPFSTLQIFHCSVSSYGIGSGPSGSGSWSTRGVGGISGDSYQQGNGIFGSHRQQVCFRVCKFCKIFFEFYPHRMSLMTAGKIRLLSIKYWTFRRRKLQLLTRIRWAIWKEMICRFPFNFLPHATNEVCKM